ncbi:PTS system mannose/fructose/sorbose family transporter subunit IID [Thermoanaerobacterium thermosaccharolyticum]|uniref:PTS system mannose/fructose/sorbose family transporter subunit IID n=1 Tax=Thermoanaerobacterium thermosaccharolyticum TaxID=1517 RepID=UPI00168186A4|nr:PTS system mannose/fructose/sorbose family transporter subunit IID [Thermoanaerobacterium thermosaccharolyticum]
MMKSNVEKQASEKLDKKDIRRAYYRWWFQSQICFNYETMQSGGVVAAIGPIIEKLYGKNKELVKQKLKQYFQIFNVTPYIGNAVIGSVVALEESKEENATETANALKTALMGPLSGIGDSIFYVILLSIFGAIAAYMAKSGSAVGLGIAFAFQLFMLWFRSKLFDIGYSAGINFITSRKAIFDKLTQSASILGLVVVGGVVASMVSVKVPYVFQYGDVKVNIQNILDSIMPKLLPLGITFFAYWILGKKKMTTVKLVFLIIAISIIGSITGILGA